MRLPIYQIDAFADRVFAGNPAAVVPLEEWLPDAVMQAIAQENNLSETAYLVPQGEGVWGLRWFTPEVEVDLCGHATLASAHLLMGVLYPGLTRVEFDTVKAGRLTVTKDGDVYTLDFPARPPAATEVDPELAEILGGPVPLAVLASRDYLVVYDDAETVRRLEPNLDRLTRIDRFAVIVTAPGGSGAGTGEDKDVDFVSRFFAPSKGVPEDPVTGSSHCSLIPYWAGRLGKTSLFARQVSARGGELQCELKGERVRIAGRGVLYLEGRITV